VSDAQARSKLADTLATSAGRPRRVRASSSQQQIVGLATRWWNGEEWAIAVKKFVAGLRQQLEGISQEEEQR
jgi:hypothetical protein